MKSFFFRFFLLIVLSYLIVLSFSKIININELLYENYSRKQIEKFINYKEKLEWLSYLFIPLFLLVKTILVATILYIGTFFYSKSKITFIQLWQIVVKGEFIFLLIGIFKIIWFYFFQKNYTLEDIQYYFPLSAINITGYNKMEAWLIYPLQTINLFEIAYIIYLSYQIGFLTKTNADNGLKIVGYSYLPALLLWVTVVMFFTLNYS